MSEIRRNDINIDIWAEINNTYSDFNDGLINIVKQTLTEIFIWA